MGREAGLTDEDIAGVQRGEAADAFDRAVLRAVDELRRQVELSDATWSALGEHFDERQRMDFVFTVGCYVTAGHGFEHLRRRARTGEVNNVAHFPKPAAGSWTENWPELGTAPVNYEDSIDPEHYKLEQQAIFKKIWLNVGRVERLPTQGQLLHPGDAVGRSRHVGDHREGQRRRGPRVLQHVPAPRKQAGVERLSGRGGLGHLPPVHLQVPRVALQPQG